MKVTWLCLYFAQIKQTIKGWKKDIFRSLRFYVIVSYHIIDSILHHSGVEVEAIVLELSFDFVIFFNQWTMFGDYQLKAPFSKSVFLALHKPSMQYVTLKKISADSYTDEDFRFKTNFTNFSSKWK